MSLVFSLAPSYTSLSMGKRIEELEEDSMLGAIAKEIALKLYGERLIYPEVLRMLHQYVPEMEAFSLFCVLSKCFTFEEMLAELEIINPQFSRRLKAWKLQHELK